MSSDPEYSTYNIGDQYVYGVVIQRTWHNGAVETRTISRTLDNRYLWFGQNVNGVVSFDLSLEVTEDDFRGDLGDLWAKLDAFEVSRQIKSL